MDTLTGVASGDVRLQVHTGQPKRTRRTTAVDPKRKSLALIAHWELPVQPVADLIAILVQRGISGWRILISIFGATILFFRNVKVTAKRRLPVGEGWCA